MAAASNRGRRLALVLRRIGRRGQRLRRALHGEGQRHGHRAAGYDHRLGRSHEVADQGGAVSLFVALALAHRRFGQRAKSDGVRRLQRRGAAAACGMESRRIGGRGASLGRRLCGRAHRRHHKRRGTGRIYHRPVGAGTRSRRSAARTQRNHHVRGQGRGRQLRSQDPLARAEGVQRPARDQRGGGCRLWTARRST